ncbi:hypothetical protein CHARACLAT_024505 [Characodon lateralis]|uniref:Uncharacterized protein n=1 Tax=Characodon lateralis TaxID=208331 RepID=A0ABU7ECK1_9TELE|nr:hypothetical protein [Characodon lateralis]
MPRKNKLNGLNHDFDHPCLILTSTHTATLRTQRRVFGSSEVPSDTDRVTRAFPKLSARPSLDKEDELICLVALKKQIEKMMVYKAIKPH